jgi:hypothetical protein
VSDVSIQTLKRALGRYGPAACEIAVLAAIFLYTLSCLQPAYLLLDTTAVGGDTPAHNYLASHLRAELFGHGRIVSWAQGWWCGFPTFQFYFCLPYVLTALLSLVMPFNVAFKLVSVLGMLSLPGCAYLSARLMRLPRPAPALLAVAMLPFLFVKSHVMWGVNIYSTLAGMISNSISFSLMLLFLGSSYRDSDDGQFRFRTVLLLSAVIASHFFTSLVAGATVLIFPFLRPKCGWARSVRVLAAEGALGALLMAWWLIPLLAKTEYTVDYGVDWDVRLLRTLPAGAIWLAPLLPAAAILAVSRRANAVWIYVWMLAVSTILFHAGCRVSSAFVNIRFWPFIFFSMLALAAAALGLLLSRLRATAIVAAAAAIAALLYVERPDNEVRAWARWNYEGLERKGLWPVFRELVFPLRGTPGRLANDLCEENNAFGSSRIFEVVPHLIGKPILEGGIVNSALGSMYSYYIQGETSRNCAGFPSIVTPTTFNITNATRHLTLFNVKHFVARWPAVQDAMSGSPDWRLARQVQDWKVFELTTHDGRYVYVPSHRPKAVTTDRRKECSLDWLYTAGAMDQPFVLIRSGESAPEIRPADGLSEAEFRGELLARRGNSGDLCEWLYLGPFPCATNGPGALDFAPVNERDLDPVEGRQEGGRVWRTIFSRCPIFLDRYQRGGQHLVSYACTYIFSPTERNAILHYSNDDDARIWLNGQPIVSSGITGLGHFESVPIRLRQGRNRLLHKCTQETGGQFFHLRLTDPSGAPFPEIVARASSEPPQAPREAAPLDASRARITRERVDEDRISFRTTGVGLPHIVKCTYFPNWRVRGARKVYWVTPGFMLVFPERPEVELYYGATTADIMGRWLSVLGLGLLAGGLWSRRRGSREPAQS